MKLIIVIPCLNEEATIGRVISDIPGKIDGISEIKVLVIDDGSTDNTAEIAKSRGASVFSHTRNKGVGAAFHSGINESIRGGADIVVNMDGDGQFNPRDISLLIRPILNKEADCVTASRFKEKSLIPRMPGMKKWGNRQIAKLVSMLVGKRFYDVSCGFRAYSQETILRMNLFGQFTYTQETFLDLVYKGIKIVEVPLAVRGEREFGTSRVAGNLWMYALNSAKILFRTFRDYKPLRFFSIASFALLFVSSCLGAFFFYHYFKTGQFSGHLWAGFSSGFLMIFSFLFFLTGLLADMFERIRRNQETLLYMEKKKIIEKNGVGHKTADHKARIGPES